MKGVSNSMLFEFHIVKYFYIHAKKVNEVEG